MSTPWINHHRISFASLVALVSILCLIGPCAAIRENGESISDQVSTTVPLSSESIARSNANASVSPSPGPGNDAEAANAAQPTKLSDVIALAHEVLAHMESNVRDYRATLVMRERIGGRLGSESRLELKLRNRQQTDATLQGTAVYLEFLSPRLVAGREVIWIENENEGNLISHEGGFKNWKRMVLDPNGTLAMLGNKYPITEIGLIKLAEKLIEKGTGNDALQDATIAILKNQSVGDRTCRMIQVTNPLPKAGLDFHIAQIFIDDERMIPLRYAAYLWPRDPTDPPPLEEEYTYLNVQLNVGLSDLDFDPDNPEYEYP